MVLNKFKNFKTTSFALWNPKDIKDLEFIKSNLSKIKPGKIILGLNPAIEIGFLENFHTRRFDHWYAEVFPQTSFAGAYMTDFISEPQVNARVILNKWKTDKKFRDKNIKDFKYQIAVLGAKDPQFFCVGVPTLALFKEAFPEYKNVTGIHHPNKRGTKRAQFVSNVKALIGALK